MIQFNALQPNGRGCGNWWEFLTSGHLSHRDRTLVQGPVSFCPASSCPCISLWMFRQLGMIKSQMLTGDGWNNYCSMTILRTWWVGLEGQLGVETVLSPEEVWDDKAIYGFQNARWTRRWSVWLLDVRPPKIPRQAKDDFIPYYTSSHTLLAWSIQFEARDKRDILIQGGMEREQELELRRSGFCFFLLVYLWLRAMTDSN